MLEKKPIYQEISFGVFSIVLILLNFSLINNQLIN